jgi:hypothetical protein
MYVYTCIQRGGVMSWIIWGISPAAELLLYNVVAICVGVVPAQGVVGVGSTNQDGPGVHSGQHPDVVLAVILPLPLDQAKLPVFITAAPVDSLKNNYN